jgi:CrcB protein
LVKIALIMVAGGVGTLSRYLLQGAAQRLAPASFPYGTLAVNLIGCFAFGIVWSLAEERFAIGPQARIVLLVGFMGAFTTYSTFAFESLQELRDAELLMAAANVAAHVVLGIALVYCGMVTARAIGGAA